MDWRRDTNHYISDKHIGPTNTTISGTGPQTNCSSEGSGNHTTQKQTSMVNGFLYKITKSCKIAFY